MHRLKKYIFLLCVYKMVDISAETFANKTTKRRKRTTFMAKN